MSRKSDKDMLNPSILFAVLGRCVDVLMILQVFPCSEVWHLLLNEEREVPSGSAVAMFRIFSLNEVLVVPTPQQKAWSRIGDWEGNTFRISGDSIYLKRKNPSDIMFSHSTNLDPCSVVSFTQGVL